MNSLLPLPSAYQPKTGRFAIDQSLTFALTGHVDDSVESAVARFAARLSKQTGISIPVHLRGPNTGSKFIIHCAGPAESVQSVNGVESYSLHIDDAEARLAAPTVLGIMHGFETLLQMVDLDEAGFFLPAAEIDDAPRFPWRGLMLDVTRHYMPLDDVKRTLDLMAAVKLNVLHLHLTDDQGFNIESRVFPDLHRLGHNGAYYTQDDIHAIVDHARSRGIRVVPEFDVPGHTAAWFAAFPHLAGYPGEYAPDRWFGSNPRNKDPHYCPAMNPALEESYEFLDALFGEMTALFPDQYFHIGGDEVTPHHWLNNPSIVEFMKANGFVNGKGDGDPHALQAHFNSRLVEIVRKYGKTMIGWDEVLHPDIPKDIAIQSWRGAESLAEAAREGHPTILSNGYYLDLMYSAEAHYRQDPLAGAAADLPADQQANILGGEACMWSEYVTPEILDDRLWPRLAAIAERFWSSADVTWVYNLYERFPSILRHLEWTGLRTEWNRSMMFDRLAGEESADGLRILAECLEPAKGYARRGYTTTSPLNRLIDVLPPESLRAREFVAACEHPKDCAAAIEECLNRWQKAGAWGLLRQSALVAPYREAFHMVGQVIRIGLDAIGYLTSDTVPVVPSVWIDPQLTILDQAAKDVNELTIAIVPGVRKLVEALR